MARLTQADADRLVSLLSRSGGVEWPSLLEAQQRLLELSTDGSLGPLLTQRLATYLNRPVRFTSADAPRLADDHVEYAAQAGGIRYWIRLDSLLASAIAEAMIGGEGDATKVGYGTKVLRLAAGAVLEMTRVIAAALQLPEPRAAALEIESRRDIDVQAGGGLSIGTRNYGWQAGLTTLESPEEPRLARAPSAVGVRAQAAPQPAPAAAKEKADGPEAALEAARRQLEHMMRAAVAFDAVQAVALTAPRMPPGWLRMSLSSRAGGAIVVSVDRQSAAALVNCALQADVVAADSSGALMESGVEVILRNALHAFAAELLGQADDAHHMVRLSDEAMLAQLPYQSIEHRFTCGRHAGVLRWLVPGRMLQARAASVAGREPNR